MALSRDLLKEVALEQQEWIQTRPLGIEREILPLALRYAKIPHVVVISGLRRCGKSTLLAQIFQKHYRGDGYYFSFEDERLVDFTLRDFNGLYENLVELFGEKKTFFLDEIQNAPGWELFVRRMNDQGFKFFITGSNASLLSREIGTRLTGRHVFVPLFPFSFREYLRFRGAQPSARALSLTSERGKLKRHFDRFLQEGGMPEFLKYGERAILQRTYEDVLYRDIVVRHEIKEVKILREMALYLLSNAGSLFTYNQLKRTFGLGSVNTAKSYVDYLQESFLVDLAGLFDYSLKRQMAAPKKLYGIDQGIVRAVSFRFSEDRGRFLENLAFMELRRRGKEIYYYKTGDGKEVDFLIRAGGKIEGLLQVARTMASAAVKTWEVGALATALRELRLKKGLILTEDEEGEIREKGMVIRIQPLYQWLLEER